MVTIGQCVHSVPSVVTINQAQEDKYMDDMIWSVALSGLPWDGNGNTKLIHWEFHNFSQQNVLIKFSSEWFIFGVNSTFTNYDVMWHFSVCFKVESYKLIIAHPY